MRMRLTPLALVLLSCGTAGLAAWQARDAGIGPSPALPGTGLITGVVIADAASAQPIRRATVRLTGDVGTSSRIVGTDDKGRFTIDRLPTGRFTLSASKPGFVPAFHGSTRPAIGPGVPIAVADGTTTDVVLRLLPGAAISGILTDVRGNPAAGVRVAAASVRPGASPVPAAAVSDDRGVYRLFGLAPGEYVVSAVPQIIAASGDGRLGGSGPPVVPVTDADVQWARAAMTGTAAPPPAAAAARPVAYAPVFFPGTTDPSAAATIRVATGEERTGADMMLRVLAMARVSGTMVDANGQSVTNAQVFLVPKRGDRQSPADALVASGALALPRAVIAPPGFTMSNVPPGEYTLVARTGGGQRGMVTAEAAAPTMWSVTDVTIGEADRSDLALRLLPGLAVSGRFVFEGASPPASPASLNLSFTAINPLPGVAGIYRAVMQPDGTFRVPSLAPGRYFVRIDPPAGGAGRGWWLKSAVADSRDFADHALVANADGSTLTDVVVTFSDRATGISGRVIDAANRPVTRYSIVVIPASRTFWAPGARRIRASQPASDGSFVVGNLPAGEYAIAAVQDLDPAELSDAEFLGRLLGSAVRITLAEGETRRQDLRVGGSRP
jgi:uncharacterized protein (DUF2141 family)